MEKEKRSALIQWGIPVMVLLVVVVVMLSNFAVSYHKSINDEIRNNMISQGKKYAREVYYSLRNVTDMGSAAADLIGKEELKNKNQQEKLEAIQKNCDASLVILTDLSGNGYTQDGDEVSLKDTPYFQKKSFSSISYCYTKDDPMENGPTVVICMPIWESSSLKGLMFFYYPTEKFSDLIEANGMNGNTGYALALEDGTVIASAGSQTSYTELGSNWLEQVEKGQVVNDSLKDIQTKIQKKNTGISEVTSSEDDIYLCFTPIGLGKMYMVLATEKNLITKLEKNEARAVNHVIVQIFITLVIFVVFVAAISIMSRLKHNEESKQLEDRADTDLLTELNNKIATERKIKEYMERNPETQSMMLVLDVDNFKKINDTMGHAFGDEVLKTLGQQLKSEFRISDIIGRTGGDEFIVFLKNLKDDKIVNTEADRVSHFFQNFKVGEYVKYSATASIGAAIFPRDGEDFESLYKAADQALYKSKKRGKNQLSFYKEEFADSMTYSETKKESDL